MILVCSIKLKKNHNIFAPNFPVSIANRCMSAAYFPKSADIFLVIILYENKKHRK